MFDEVMTQDTNAADDGMDTGFLEGLGDEFAEEQPTEQDTNAPEAQEEQTEESTEEQDTNAAEENAPEEATTEEQPEQGIEVTFLGEKRQLTHDEAVTFAQKGMNYDRTEQLLNESRATVARLEAELSAPRAGDNMMPLVKA